jgi:hypothetical protein
LKLYKYLPPERIDVLSNGLIRFTQPALFNDPFEMSPYISAIASEEEIDEIFDAKHEAQVEEQYLNHNRAFRRRNSLERFKKGFTKEVLLPRIRESAKGAALDHARDSLSIAMSQAIGVLCLTGKADNLLMWAHYADSHTGLVIELDVEHPFFKQVFEDPLSPVGLDEDLSKDYGYLKPMVYDNHRPEITISSVKSFDSFLIKSKDWAYEEEWRMLMPTANATKVIKMGDGVDICLYEVPKVAITKVILGCRASDELLNLVKQIKESDEDLSHLQIEKMALDKKDFRLISNIV